ncbi:MAG TPA: hypothetical protein VNA57_01855 [Acidimicrobiales bacterium]|nr:hypothetical protein [Acidimicrobiales bacterium]
MDVPAPQPRLGDEALWKLYETGVEEYRFQVLLNNQRFQWYVAIDVALITVGTGLLRLSSSDRGERLTALVFVVGAVLAAFTARATATQVGCQHAARAQVKKVAQELGVEELSVRSTGGWRGKPTPWWMKVRAMNYALLAVLAGVNIAGVIYVFQN